MRGLEVGEQKIDRDRLDAAFGGYCLGERAHFVLGDGLDDLAVAIDAPVDFVAIAALHQRRRFDPGYVVVALAISPLNEGYVAEAARRYVGGDRALTLEDGVCGDRRPQSQVADIVVAFEVPEAGKHAVGGIGGRGRGLPHLDRARFGLIGDEVGERAAHVDADQITWHAADFSGANG